MIAIKGMEMPKSCGKCPFQATFPNTGLKNGVCNDLHIPFKRHPYCPLVEIVTCKDCTNHVKGALDEEICLKGHELIHENFYCADGERGE